MNTEILLLIVTMILGTILGRSLFPKSTQDNKKKDEHNKKRLELEDGIKANKKTLNYLIDLRNKRKGGRKSD